MLTHLRTHKQEGGTFKDGMKLKEFAKAVGIDRNVLTRRMKGAVAMDASTGPTPLLNKEKEVVIVDTMRRYDRANNGQDAAKGASLVQELNPKLTRKQSVNVFSRIRKKNKNVLTGDVKAQQSTSKRSEVTVTAQNFWHETVESVRMELRKRNTGVDDDDEQTIAANEAPRPTLDDDKDEVRNIDENEVSDLVRPMPPPQLVGLRLKTPYNGEIFPGTVKSHLGLSEGHRFVINYDDDDVEVMETSSSEYKYIKDIDQLKEFITAAYVSKTEDCSDLYRNARSSNKRHKRSTDDSNMHYGALPSGFH